MKSLIQAAMPFIPLANETVQCAVTSPPYYGLRAYDIPATIWGGDPGHEHEWITYSTRTKNGGTKSSKVKVKGQANFQIVPPMQQAYCKCGAWKGQLGAEPTLSMYVEHMVQVFREVRRVLKLNGVLWLNLGDSYNGSGGAGGDYNPGGIREGQPKFKPFKQPNMKPKDLMGVPWEVALALRNDGWYLRSDCIWYKTNQMPSSVIYKVTPAHEHVFMLTKSSKYFFDKNAISETGKDGRPRARRSVWAIQRNATVAPTLPLIRKLSQRSVSSLPAEKETSFSILLSAAGPPVWWPKN